MPTNQSWQKHTLAILTNNEIFCLLINIEELAKTQTQHADLTGRLPQSLRGNQYLLISEYRGYIHLKPQASRTGSDYIKSHAATTVFFRRHCNYHESPTILRIDNETSDALSSYIRNDLGMKLEYVPPGNHRTLKEERAIQTAKNHCIYPHGPPHQKIFQWNYIGTGSWSRSN